MQYILIPNSYSMSLGIIDRFGNLFIRSLPLSVHCYMLFIVLILFFRMHIDYLLYIGRSMWLFREKSENIWARFTEEAVNWTLLQRDTPNWSDLQGKTAEQLNTSLYSSCCHIWLFYDLACLDCFLPPSLILESHLGALEFHVIRWSNFWWNVFWERNQKESFVAPTHFTQAAEMCFCVLD